MRLLPLVRGTAHGSRRRRIGDQLIPHVPVRQWVLIGVMRLPIPRRLLLAAQLKLMTAVLHVVHRVITSHLLGQAGLKPDEADSGAVTLIQRFGSAANLSLHLHCMVLEGLYRPGANGAPVFVEAPAPTDEALQTVLLKIITRLTQAAYRSGGVGRAGQLALHDRRRRRFGPSPRAQVRDRRRHAPTASPSARAPARGC